MPKKLTPDAVDQTPDVTLADVLDEDALLTELAALSLIAYDRRRDAAAKQLSVRVATLDATVAARRPRQEEPDGVGTPVLFTDPEPWPESVDGALLLDDLSTLYTRYVVLPQGGADMLALWTVHTYTHGAALHKLEERPWSEWGRQEKPITARQVARLLGPFGIKSKTIRIETDTPKGYEQEDFVDAWERYLPLLSATPPQVSNDAGFHAPSSATASNNTGVADDDDRNPALQADCGGVVNRDKKPVADERARNPASDNGCGAVADHTPVFEAWQDEHISPGAHCPMGGHHNWLRRGSGGRLCARCNAEE